MMNAHSVAQNLGKRNPAQNLFAFEICSIEYGTHTINCSLLHFYALVFLDHRENGWKEIPIDKSRDRVTSGAHSEDKITKIRSDILISMFPESQKDRCF